MHKHTSKNACTHTHTNGPTNVIISFSSCPLLLYPILFLCICLLSCIFHPVICHSILYLCHLSPILYLFILSSVILSYFFVTYILSYTFFICYQILFLCYAYPILYLFNLVIILLSDCISLSHISYYKSIFCIISSVSVLYLHPITPSGTFLAKFKISIFGCFWVERKPLSRFVKVELHQFSNEWMNERMNALCSASMSSLTGSLPDVRCSGSSPWPVSPAARRDRGLRELRLPAENSTRWQTARYSPGEYRPTCIVVSRSAQQT